MELLYHFEHCVAPAHGLGDETTSRGYQQMSVKEAFRTPFLMDQLLALAAAHKSTLPGEDQMFWRSEATRLQTRGLTQFNAAKAEVSTENFLSIFLYSTCLGQHVLFDTFSVPGDFSTVLDKLVHCMSLHRGIRTIVAGSWPTLRAHLEANMGSDSRFIKSIIISQGNAETGDECKGLFELLEKSDLSESARGCCREAVENLQLMFDIQRDTTLSAARRMSTVQEWSIRVSTEFVSLLDQRRPEALVVLAYWGIVLHNVRNSWAFGDAGRTLIESVSAHLGSYWSEWLAWPRKMLESSDAPLLRLS
ncbi:hypothetical protein CCHL11_00768 [Colletotrichum chlorophyti]|uniref:Uncharacterized protein n=1 Tax=Colletotrichum chlorophyti TaxID=708187 RepID=A0A1Q8S5K4_9PEZI|nr:hypothetical protein CCHL11_00768 [Colletotrichum chlorophyti]